jgi:hypothetical protein
LTLKGHAGPDAQGPTPGAPATAGAHGSLVEGIQGALRDASKVVALKAVEGVADGMMPGADQIVRLFEARWKLVNIFGHLTKEDGAGLSLSVQAVHGFWLDFSAPVGAEHPVLPLGVEPVWHPLPPDSLPIEIGVEPGKPDARPQRPTTAKEPAGWFELEFETPAPAATKLRAGLVDPIDPPASSEVAEHAAVIALTAPARDVLGNSSMMTAQAVVNRAAELGAFNLDDETGLWFLNLSRGTPGFRRRVRVIAYLDPISGLIAIVEVGVDGRAAFGYFVLDPSVVPEGVSAETLTVTPRFRM